MTKMLKQIIIILLLILIFFLLRASVAEIESFAQIIPLNIYQTWRTKELPPKMKECVDIVKTHNPAFQHYLYDDNDCRNFIDEFFDNDVLNAYDKLIPGAYKADLWRLCVLYINGGIYLDIKYHNINGFNFIEMTNKEYYVKDIEQNGGGIYNALLVCKPNNSKLLNCINKIVKNVNNKYYGDGALSITGPMLIKTEFSQKELDNLNELSLGELEDSRQTCLYFKNKPILAIYKEYRDEQNKFNDLPNYHTLYANKQVYK